MSAAMSTGHEVHAEIVDVATVCDFCEYDAVSRYRDVMFCQHHLVWFYFGLSLEWTD